MKLAKDLLICCALIALSAFLIHGAMLLAATESAMAGVDLSARLDRAEASLSETTRQLRALVQDSKDSLDDNYYDVRAQVETTSVILRSLSDTVDEVNKKLLPSATVAVANLGSAASNGADAAQSLRGAVDGLGRLATALKADAEAAKPTIDGATALLATLDSGASVTLGDIDARVKALEPIQRNFESTSKHIDGAAANTEATLGFIRDDFSPKKASFWVKLANAATAGMFSVFLHWLPQNVHSVD